jgi:hypothetical protein
MPGIKQNNNVISKSITNSGYKIALSHVGTIILSNTNVGVNSSRSPVKLIEYYKTYLSDYSLFIELQISLL